MSGARRHLWQASPEAKDRHVCARSGCGLVRDKRRATLGERYEYRTPDSVFVCNRPTYAPAPKCGAYP